VPFRVTDQQPAIFEIQKNVVVIDMDGKKKTVFILLVTTFIFFPSSFE
jgi:hypothetical protein